MSGAAFFVSRAVYVGLFFYFYIIDDENRELISYTISTAFLWVEAIRLYNDLSIGQRILEMINIRTTLVKDGTILRGNGWGSACGCAAIFREIVDRESHA